MGLRISITGNRLHRDSLNPPDADDAEIVFWKRVKVEGMASEGGWTADFEVRLDVRSRLMQVQVDGSQISATQVAEALVNEMTSYTLNPRSALFVPRPREDRVAEWIVRDAEHVSGLLHRLREGKEFDARPTAPDSPGYAEVRAALLEAIDENLTVIDAWRYHRANPTQHAFHLPFNLYAWAMARQRFLEGEPSLERQLHFAKFFDNLGQLDAGMKFIRANPSTRPDYSKPSPQASVNATESHVGQLAEPTYGLGLKLMMDHGREHKILPHFRT